MKASVLIDPLAPTVVDADGILHAVAFGDQVGKAHRVTRDTACGRRVRCELLGARAVLGPGETANAVVLLAWPPPARGHGSRCPECMATADVSWGRRDRPSPAWRKITDPDQIVRLAARR